MNVIQTLYNLLITLGYPVAEQGSLQEGEPIPDVYITYWNYETTPKYYSGEIVSYDWVLSVFIYCNSSTLAITKSREIVNLLLENGFCIGSNSTIDSGEIGVHAREIEIQYIEKI